MLTIFDIYVLSSCEDNLSNKQDLQLKTGAIHTCTLDMYILNSSSHIPSETSDLKIFFKIKNTLMKWVLWRMPTRYWRLLTKGSIGSIKYSYVIINIS